MERKRPSALSTSVLADWNVAPEYSVDRVLGRGVTGVVAQGLELKNGKAVAVKRMQSACDSPANVKRLYRELCILRSLQHPNLVRLLDVLAPSLNDADSDAAETSSSSSSPAKKARMGQNHRVAVLSPGPSFNSGLSDVYLVFEHAETDLQKLLDSPQFLSEMHCRYIACQLLRGLRHLHDNGIIHRDLKPANVLLNLDCSVKLCDFGLSRKSPFGSGPSSSPSAMSSTGALRTVLPAPPPPLQSAAVTPSAVPAAKKLTRSMTMHVVTRWYRAPELLLQRSEYSSSVDMWAVGCILAELLGMQKESVPCPLDRNALFPGRSSALSPFAEVECHQTEKERLGQLETIFSVIGTPSAADIALVPDEATQQFLASQPHRKAKDLKMLLPGADSMALDFLQQLLSFSPENRLTVHEALAHPWLAEYAEDEHHAKVPTVSQSVSEAFSLCDDSSRSGSDLVEALHNEILLHRRLSARY